MRTYLKRVKKLSYLYFICLIVFFVIAIAVIGISIGIFKGDGISNSWLSVISCFAWFYGVYAWYLEAKKMGQADKMPYYNLKPNPFRGFLIGVITMMVIALGAFVISYVILFFFTVFSLILVPNIEPFTWNNVITNNIWNYLIKFSFSPFYWLANLAGNKFWQYPIAALTYPITIMIGYTIGLYKSGVEKLKKEINNKKNN